MQYPLFRQQIVFSTSAHNQQHKSSFTVGLHHTNFFTMSQWLTSGRNRLLEKQKEKQRFGIANQHQDHQIALSRELPSAAVSTGAYSIGKHEFSSNF